ncbi:bifunctional helix-turn-helix transcriptional regulator/GNAT family N-acetyltransferase [Methylovirgula sp. 4M-Z18]|uniref:bifunctional helix-turn-helix transcriptional regulator/GNAT family N-acetyltransferase n=1 Tax=Methylovirgula sp. 4M-Z18 TaxID=2293567 RepID=UPI000E2ED5E2|nr:helix-turn-helix domain-containing GNAT family N-acetyltransferase [Methylovirgula sp. 4M-Z18]RFB80463.1 MarR family transcriptional regulator [Methylovirgula sp. 4M-Z18]
MPTSSHEQDVAALRTFNRVYTNRLGLLNSHLDKSPFALGEARVLYELAHRTDPTAAELSRALNLDRAQISRTLKRFGDRGLVGTREDPQHGRHRLLSLTPAGLDAFAALEANTRATVGAMLEALPPVRRTRMLAAAHTMTKIFEAESAPSVTLRDPRAGDFGLVVHRQAVLYTEEYGWNDDYEALVARILADFRQSFDPAREAAWIADLDGRMVGSIFLVRSDKPEVGKLRLLYVEPEARGMGVGKMLVDACVERACAVGYRRIDLWTNSILTSALRLYQRAGFRLVHEEPHHSFGHDLVGQTWSLDL